MNISDDNLDLFLEYLGNDYLEAGADDNLNREKVLGVLDLINYYCSVSKEERINLLNKVTLEVKWVLLGFVVDMSERAINDHDMGSIKNGLMALFIDNYSYDNRETIIVSYVLLDCSRRIGVDIVELLNSLSEFSPKRAFDSLKTCYIAYPDSKMETYGYYVKEQKDGYMKIRSKNRIKLEDEEKMVSYVKDDPIKVEKVRGLFFKLKDKYENEEW